MANRGAYVFLLRGRGSDTATYLITGVAGFIGSHLAEALIADGHRVLGLDHFTNTYPPELKWHNLTALLKHPEFSLVEGDILEMEMRSMIEGCDGVYHLAAQAGVRGSWRDEFTTYLHRNVLATQRILEALVQEPRLRLVYASSSSVYGDRVKRPTPEEVPLHPYSPYGVTKLAAEMLVDLYHANHGLDTVSLRFFTVYGPRQRPDMAFTRFLAQMAAGKSLTLFGQGDSYRDYTFVTDIVRGLRLAMDKGLTGRVYNLGGGHRVPLSEAVELLTSIKGKSVRRVRKPMSAGDVLGTAADTSRAREELGWRAMVTLRKGLKEQVTWFEGLPHELKKACVDSL